MALTRITAQQISDSDFKQSVRVVNTTNVNLTGGAPSTVDGVSLVAQNRILVIGQSTASQNGLYNVATVGTGSNGTWTRTYDGDTTGEITSGMIVMATEGTAYQESEWLLITNDPIVLGTTALAFIQLNATIYSGTSNVAVVNSGNVAISSAGVANVAVVSADGVYVNSNLYVSTNAVITGNLTVNGTTTTINSNTITTNDKTITVANNQSTGAGVDGAGFDAGGGTPIATWRYNNATTSWQSNIGITPESNATISLGGSSNYWGTVYITTASVTGNVIGGNITTAGLISATGNIAGSYFIGNGSQLSGLPATYGNANVVANLASLGTNPVSTTGNVTAGYFFGNGSQLSNVAATSIVANISAAAGNTSLVYAGVADNDYFRIMVGGTNDSGFAEIAIGDNSNDPIYVRQYNFVNSNPFGTISRTLTLLDTTGNTSIPGSLTVTGNTTSGNILTAGLVSATANITGGNILTAGIMSSTGNAIHGNILTAGLISATSTITSSANITGGNILTGGYVSATGNVTGNYIIGNGSQLTGTVANATYATSAGSAGTAATVTTAAQPNITSVGILSSVSVTGNVTGTNLYGTLQTAAQLNVTSLGALSSLTVSGNASVGNLTTGGTISATSNITGGNLSGTNIVGTLTTAAQTNITSVGTLGSLTVTANVQSGNLLTAGQISATGTITTGGGTNSTGFAVGNGAVSNVALGMFPTAGTPGEYAIRDYSNVYSAMYFDVGMGGTANGAFQFRTSNSFRQLANINSSGITTPLAVSATGNVTGSYFIGNGSQLTGISSGSSSNITNGTSNVTVAASGNVTVAVAGTAAVATFYTAGITANSIAATNNGGAYNFKVGDDAWLGDINTADTIGIRGQQNNANGYIVFGNADSSTKLGRAGSGPLTYDAAFSAVGNVTGGNLRTTGLISATGAITTGGDHSLTGNIVDTGALWINTLANGNITLNANGTGVITFNNPVTNGQANGVGNIGSATGYFNTVFAKATSAQYADLAEMYVADADYPPGTVLEFGGNYEVTISSTAASPLVAGVVSTNPAHLMNSTAQGEHLAALALVGRVPTQVIGPVSKGAMMVSAGNGFAQACSAPSMGTVIGKALEDFDGQSGTIEIVVGRL